MEQMVITTTAALAIITAALMVMLLFVMGEQVLAMQVLWGSLKILGLIITLVALGLLARRFKDEGTRYLEKDLAYLGYIRPLTSSVGENDYSTISPARGSKPLSRAFAFFAYRADILTLNMGNPKAIHKSSAARLPHGRGKYGNIKLWNFEYINKDLRTEVYHAIKLERQFHASKRIAMVNDAAFPLATYLFASMKNGEVQLDEERMGFFQRNSFAPDMAYRLRDIDFCELEPFDGLPHGLVMLYWVSKNS